MLIDFSKYELTPASYSGANGRKLSVVYNDELYMLKFPSIALHNDNLHYSNSVLSEFIGCHIYQELGIDVQETLLGIFTENGNQYPVVACKDFLESGYVLQDFAATKNRVFDSFHGGYGTDLNSILEALDEQQYIPNNEMKKRFWQMFVVDTLIGNWDRHNGNWGTLYNRKTRDIKLAPVYDCGSCLFAEADEQIMQEVIKGGPERDLRIYDKPTSTFRVDGKRITYSQYFNGNICHDCKKVLFELYPKIEDLDIQSVISKVPKELITETQSNFYTTIIKERQNNILLPAYQKVCEDTKNLQQLGQTAALSLEMFEYDDISYSDASEEPNNDPLDFKLSEDARIEATDMELN